MLCWLADDCNPQLEEIVSTCEITNKRIFNVAERMFKPDRRLSPDKRFEALMFINGNRDFKSLLFLFQQYFQVFVVVD